MTEKAPAASARLVRACLTGSLGLSVLLAGLLVWNFCKVRTTTFLLVAGALLALRFLAGWLERRRLPVDWLLIVAVINLFVIVPELALRATDFRFESGIQFGYPRPSEWVDFVADEKLFWRLKQGQPGVNSQGFPGDEWAEQKPAGGVRVLFLGDSVTHHGYPDLVEGFLRVADPEQRPIEAIPLAVSGYSSHQGRVLAEEYGRKLDPDAAVVYFGWNDHWLAYGARDANRQVQVSDGGFADKLYGELRILQAAQKLRLRLTGGAKATEPLTETRVTEEEYLANLQAIRAVFAERGVPVIFVTAPTSFYNLGVPEWLVDLKFIPDREAGAELHRRYNRIVRENFDGGGSEVLDLENDYARLDDEALEALFMRDGIHFTKQGNSALAYRIYQALLPHLRDRAE